MRFIYNSPDYIKKIIHPHPASHFTYLSSQHYITLNFQVFSSYHFRAQKKKSQKTKDLKRQQTSSTRASALGLLGLFLKQGCFRSEVQRGRVNLVTRPGSVSVHINTAAASWHGSDNDAQKRPPRERHMHEIIMMFPFIRRALDFPKDHLLTSYKPGNYRSCTGRWIFSEDVFKFS